MPELEFPALADLMDIVNSFMHFVFRGMRGNWCVNFLLEVWDFFSLVVFAV